MAAGAAAPTEAEPLAPSAPFPPTPQSEPTSGPAQAEASAPEAAASSEGSLEPPWMHAFTESAATDALPNAGLPGWLPGPPDPTAEATQTIEPLSASPIEPPIAQPHADLAAEAAETDASAPVPFGGEPAADRSATKPEDSSGFRLPSWLDL
jgi:hypothetical protein